MTTAALTARKQVQPTTQAYKALEIGRVMNVGSSVAVIQISKSLIRNNQLNMAQIGTILKVLTSKSIVVAMVSSLKIGANDDEGMSDGCIANFRRDYDECYNERNQVFQGGKIISCDRRARLQYVPC